MIACSDFIGTSRDRDRCHLCLQPRKAHPADNDRDYWAQWLIFHVLLELTE